MDVYRDLACSLYCDRVRNRATGCATPDGFACGGHYRRVTRGVSAFIYPRKYCEVVELAVTDLAATIGLMHDPDDRVVHECKACGLVVCGEGLSGRCPLCGAEVG